MSTSPENHQSIVIQSQDVRKAPHDNPNDRYVEYHVEKETLDSIRLQINSVLLSFKRLDIADSGASSMSSEWQFRIAGITNNGAVSVEEHVKSTNETLRKLQSDNPVDWPKCVFQATYTNTNWDKPITVTKEIPVHLSPDGGSFDKPSKNFDLSEEGNTVTLHSFACTDTCTEK